jgi:hypothetical protein
MAYCHYCHLFLDFVYCLVRSILKIIQPSGNRIYFRSLTGWSVQKFNNLNLSTPVVEFAL